MEAKDDKEREEAFEELKIGVTPIKDLVGQVSAEGRTVWTFDPAQSLLQVVEYFSKGALPKHFWFWALSWLGSHTHTRT